MLGLPAAVVGMSAPSRVAVVATTGQAVSGCREIVPGRRTPD